MELGRVLKHLRPDRKDYSADLKSKNKEILESKRLPRILLGWQQPVDGLADSPSLFTFLVLLIKGIPRFSSICSNSIQKMHRDGKWVDFLIASIFFTFLSNKLDRIRKQVEFTPDSQYSLL